MVLLHGFTCDPSAWADWPGYLSPALPFHGADMVAKEPTMAALVDAVLKWLAQNVTEPAIVAGHSLGGMLALGVALAQPERIQSLILVDAFPSLALNARVLPELFGPATTGAVRRRVTTMMRAGRERLGAERQAQLWKSLTDFDVSGRLGELCVPVEAVYGGRGRYSASESGRLKSDLGLERIPQCELSVVAGAGHFVHWEAPEKLTKLLHERIANG